ncbi:MAG: dienelactone hydrolase family protein [Pseudomonadota bacterium]
MKRSIPLICTLIVGALTVQLVFGAIGVAAGESVQYTLGDENFEGYFSPAENSKGLVLIVHDWDGLTEYEERRANMLARMGYDAFAADLFGAGVRPTTVTDKRQHTGELYKDRERMRALLKAALASAYAEGANKRGTVAMGYCFGGAAVLELARSGAELNGFATFHGGLSTPEGQNYESTKGKVLVFHGSADTAITMQDFATLADELETAGVRHEMTTYSGAPHAFTVFGSGRYQRQADQQSWAAFTEYLKTEFGSK